VNDCCVGVSFFVEYVSLCVFVYGVFMSICVFVRSMCISFVYVNVCLRMCVIGCPCAF